MTVPAGAEPGTVTAEDLAGDPALWSAAAPSQLEPDAAPDDTTGTTWDPHRMIADAYAGRPIRDDDWDVLCRQFDADGARNLLTQLQAEGAAMGPGGGGRDTSNDGALPGGGPGPRGRGRLRLYHWARWKPINQQASPGFGPIAQSLLDW